MSEPSLDQYPGFFPAAKRPFWSRAKVGTATGVVGLLLGIGIGASEEQPIEASNPEVKALVSAGVDEQTSTLDDRAEQLQADLDEAHEGAASAAAAAHHTLAVTKKAAEKAKQKAVKDAVAKAVAAEKAKQEAAAPSTYGFAGSGSSGSSGGSTSGGSDPLFGTCGEANDNGYGPYREGVDPEYSHYDDRDNDGLVCEP